MTPIVFEGDETGLSARLRMLVVCHCYRSSDEIIRIISARKVNKDEEKQYWERWK
jgi:hypothetical protein